MSRKIPNTKYRKHVVRAVWNDRATGSPKYPLYEVTTPKVRARHRGLSEELADSVQLSNGKPALQMRLIP